MAFYRCGGGGGKKSIILPSNPILTVKEDDSRLILSWTQPITEIPVDHYSIYYSEVYPTALESMIKVGETAETSYTIVGLENNKNYYIVVASVDADGYENASLWQIKNGRPSSLRIILSSVTLGDWYTTIDGVNWSKIDTTPSFSNTAGGVSGYTDGKFYVINPNDKAIAYSEDLINWTKKIVSVPSGKYIGMNLFHVDSEYKYFVGQYGILKAPRGTENWSYTAFSQNFTANYYLWDCTFFNGKFYMTANYNNLGKLYVGEKDGTLTEIDVPQAAALGWGSGNRNFYGLYVENDTLYIVGRYVNTSNVRYGTIIKTTNGVDFVSVFKNTYSTYDFRTLIRYNGKYYISSTGPSIFEGNSLTSLSFSKYSPPGTFRRAKIIDNVMYMYGDTPYMIHTNDGVNFSYKKFNDSDKNYLVSTH